ncbi:hypothetical protein MUK70_11980 [Dyadobacter chenwenxiniae]|uniref:Uncharacterized protein n=1 Tax=Dyadobacter chenwenxiniae TaxID=2906456 RepID=A0A9X1PIF9_9BACT|nr:hypothetical protein [Dyadobacter chenwenxiniae]MCF0059961.1 hypothetical protein [Dyadobacter chenwenxiniae]UON85700.1 hypothetical protein MUK70_11980 [Dyadobacter chenwenxiniae]
MNIYLITDESFDDRSGSGLVKWVVAAENEQEAIKINPEVSFQNPYNPEWYKDAKIQLIGVASESISAGLICSDWYQEVHFS